MLTIFEKIILGHLVGDYLLQPKKMAILKQTKGLNGLVWCLIHCLIYTLVICLFTSTIEPIKVILIFISHFPIDRWSLAGKWLKLIKGRSFMEAYQSEEKLREVDLAFSAIVYVIVDNAFHVLLMWAIFNYL